MIDVVYEDNHIIIVNKKSNIPVQEDSSKDLDLFNMVKSYIKEKYNKPGNVYLGLLHRLDRPTSGLIMFAKTSKAAGRLSLMIRERKIKKTYHAVIEGTTKEKDTLIDNLLKDPKTNIVKVDKSGLHAELNYEKIGEKDELTLVKIDLITGRSHQIRVQFSSRNMPVYGDIKYNKKAAAPTNLALAATSLEFIHPVSKELLKIEIDLPNIFPFNIFTQVV